MTIHPVVVLHKINAVLIATLKPLGIWGLGGLAFIDAGFFPLPTTMDGVGEQHQLSQASQGPLPVYC